MRKAGQTNTSKVPLNVLVDRLKDNAGIQVVVSNKWLKQCAEVLGVSFDDYLTETVEAAEAAKTPVTKGAPADAPKFSM